jgi:hypothetical protein
VNASYPNETRYNPTDYIPCIEVSVREAPEEVKIIK